MAEDLTEDNEEYEELAVYERILLIKLIEILNKSSIIKNASERKELDDILKRLSG